MAEENKTGGLLDQAKEMLQGAVGDGSMLDKAKDMLGDKAGDLLQNVDSLKEKAVEIGKAIAPDSLDAKVEGAVDAAVDFLKDKLGKNPDKA